MVNKLYCLNYYFSLLGLTVYGCINHENCPGYVQIPAELSPIQLNYRVGDTITISSKFYREVAGFNSDYDSIGTFDLENMQWQPSTSILRTDTLGQVGLVIFHKYFSFIESNKYDYHLFIESENFSALDGHYNYENDTFDLQFKFVLLKPGTYFLKQECGTNFYGQQKFPGKCPGDNVSAWVEMNKGDSNNIQLLRESPDSFFSKGVLSNPKTNFFDYGGYCFKVIP